MKVLVETVLNYAHAPAQGDNQTHTRVFIPGMRKREALERSAAPSGPDEFLQIITVWVLVVVLMFISLAAGYLFWAKLTVLWPFSQ